MQGRPAAAQPLADDSIIGGDTGQGGQGNDVGGAGASKLCLHVCWSSTTATAATVTTTTTTTTATTTTNDSVDGGGACQGGRSDGVGGSASSQAADSSAKTTATGKPQVSCICVGLGVASLVATVWHVRRLGFIYAKLHFATVLFILSRRWRRWWWWWGGPVSCSRPCRRCQLAGC